MGVRTVGLEVAATKRRERKENWLLASLFAAPALFAGAAIYIAVHRAPDNVRAAESGSPIMIVSEPPSNISVNGSAWELIPVSGFTDGTLAETSCEMRTIWYIPAPDMGQMREELWHEVFHAGACAHGGDQWWNSIKPTGTEHPGIYHLGMFMASFSAANPDFMKWSEK